MGYLKELGDARFAAPVAVALLVVGGALGAVALASGSGGTSGGASRSATITVSGTGAATGTPDTMTLQLGVSTNAASATGALERNDREMRSLEAVLKGSGVRSSGIETNDLEISPNYGSGATITGYNATNDLTANFHDIARAGTVIDAAARAVGNDIEMNGISFSISNTSKLLSRARLAALDDARADAVELARGAHEALGPALTISDHEQSMTPPPTYGVAVPDATKSAVPLDAGTEVITVQVSVKYQLTR